jgi:hypothetical protein
MQLCQIFSLESSMCQLERTVGESAGQSPWCGEADNEQEDLIRCAVGKNSRRQQGGWGTC